jgi:hypothetical protein
MSRKPMAVIPHVPVYHVIQYKIIISEFYIHAFASLTFLTYSAHHFLQKGRVHVQQSVYHESYKYVCFWYTK